MSKAIRPKGRVRKGAPEEHLPLHRENFIILGIGLAVIAAGYIAMWEGSVEGFLPLVLAPILLVLGYCVIIPFGIFYRKSMFSRATGQTPIAGSREA